MYILLFLFEIIILFFLSRKLIYKITNLIYSITRNEGTTDLIYAILFLPGTFFHEAAHFLMALFLLVPVGNIELMPQREGKSLKLGSVPIGKTDPLRRMLVGAAPLIFGIAIILIGLFLAVSREILPGNIWVNILAVYLVFQIANTMFMSKKDREGMWVVIVIFIIIFTTMYLLGVKLSLEESSLDLVNKVMRQAVYFLSIPIAIDLIILIILKIIRK